MATAGGSSGISTPTGTSRCDRDACSRPVWCSRRGRSIRSWLEKEMWSACGQRANLELEALRNVCCICRPKANLP